MSHPSFPELCMPSALPVSARFLGFPSSARPLLHRLRYRPQVAPRSVPPALPVMDRRVASIHASFGGAGCENSRLPLRFTPPVSPTIRFQVAPVPHPPAPADYRPSRLGPRTIRFASLMHPDCSVCPRLASPPDFVSSRPETRFVRRRRFRLSRVAPKRPSSADPYLHPQVAPASAYTAGSMITPWLNRTLHPQLALRMNLRYQSGINIPDLASGALSISICPFSVGEPTSNFVTETVTCAFCRTGAEVPISYRVTS
jgi:hypothetical protein